MWFRESCFYACMEQASKSPGSISFQTNWFGGNESIHSLSKLYYHQVLFSCKISDSEEAAFTHSWNRLQNHQVQFSSKLIDLEENVSIHSLSRLHCHQVPFSHKLQDHYIWSQILFVKSFIFLPCVRVFHTETKKVKVRASDLRFWMSSPHFFFRCRSLKNEDNLVRTNIYWFGVNSVFERFPCSKQCSTILPLPHLQRPLSLASLWGRSGWSGGKAGSWRRRFPPPGCWGYLGRSRLWVSKAM